MRPRHAGAAAAAVLALCLPACEHGVRYADCDAARAAGAAPLHRGDPGYRDELDADHDGLACV